jgi:hypothetical protein
MRHSTAVAPSILPILSAMKENSWSPTYAKAVMRIAGSLPQISGTPDHASAQEQAVMNQNTVLRSWRAVIRASARGSPEIDHPENVHRMQTALVPAAGGEEEAMPADGRQEGSERSFSFIVPVTRRIQRRERALSQPPRGGDPVAGLG